MKLERWIAPAVFALALALPQGAAALPGPSCAAVAPAGGLGAALAMADLGSSDFAVQKSAICVWSCQYNPNFGTWKYWFAPALSSCPVTQCQPRGGSSPSGTLCNQGDPDIPGDCVP